jgi:hypothetical protein
MVPDSGWQKGAPVQRHLERSLVLNTVSEFKNLYSWSVSEVGEASARALTNQIPWGWSLYFTLFDIQLISSISRDRYSAPEDEALAVVEKTHIRAKLRPGHPSDGSRTTDYSMFGTARKIEEISLSIYPKLGVGHDDCHVFGGVSYTHDADFRDETYPDYLGFTLHIREEAFTQIASRIDQRALGGGTFRVDEVEGFYSDWSPSISTNHIKVLTSDKKDHHVETPEGCEIVPPRLGKVGDFDLTLWSHLVHPAPIVASASEGNEDAAAEARGEASPPNSLLIGPKILSSVKSLQFTAWIIVALLLVVAFK